MAITDVSVRREEVDPVVLELPRPITEETLIELASKNPQYRFETTADGRLVVTPGTGIFASGGEAELVRQVANWNKDHDLGHVSSSSGYLTLANSAVKGPDCTFTSWDSIDAQLPLESESHAYENLAADATFELKSPTDKVETLVAKCEEYVDTGSKVAVLLNPRDRSVTLYRPNQEPTTAPDILAVTIGDEMPGFILNAEAVFNASKRRRRLP